MTNTQQQPHYLVLGEILRPHGVRGEMRMRVITDYPERLINQVKTVYLGTSADEADADTYTLKSARFHKDYLLITLDDVSDRNQADPLRGQLVMIDLDHAVPLAEGEYYLYQLIGLAVQTDTGIQLGKIQQVIETGANDVYVVKGREYGEILLPAHDETLINVDFEAGLVTMKLPEGLLPD
ncbi:MAG: ribosome maturation factor RimM [Anaerolineae bacterium]